MVVGEHGRCVDQEAFTVVSLFARVCVLVHVYVCCLRRLFYFFDNCCLSFCFCLFFLATVLCFSNLKFECLHFVCACVCAFYACVLFVFVLLFFLFLFLFLIFLYSFLFYLYYVCF